MKLIGGRPASRQHNIFPVSRLREAPGLSLLLIFSHPLPFLMWRDVKQKEKLNINLPNIRHRSVQVVHVWCLWEKRLENVTGSEK